MFDKQVVVELHVKHSRSVSAFSPFVVSSKKSKASCKELESDRAIVCYPKFCAAYNLYC